MARGIRLESDLDIPPPTLRLPTHLQCLVEYYMNNTFIKHAVPMPISTYLTLTHQGEERCG